jgi:hypothetical protein
VAKKKKRRRPAPRPAVRTEPSPARAERKEEARKEREARIRRARRRVLLRRLSRVGIVVVLATLIAGFIYWRGEESRRQRAEAAEAAERLGCSQVEDLPEEGRQHLAAGEQPPDYATTPGTSGKHNGQPLPADPRVYDQPFDANLEARAVHNLEHGSVLLYYRPQDDAGVPKSVVDALADLANAEDQVILAPYPDLPDEQSLAFAAWTHLRSCPTVTADDADDVIAVARGFIDEYRDHSDAPEAPAL